MCFFTADYKAHGALWSGASSLSADLRLLLGRGQIRRKHASKAAARLRQQIIFKLLWPTSLRAGMRFFIADIFKAHDALLLLQVKYKTHNAPGVV